MLISILSTFYNDREMLVRTLDSVLGQSYQKIEHVVTDGGSIDGSVEVLKEYEEKYKKVGKKLIWKSEQDSGIYDGSNKAAAMASGDYLLFGTDPYVDDTVIGYIVNSLKKYNVDYVYGGMYFQREGKIIRCWSGKPGNWRFGWMAATPTLAMKRSVWEKHGPLDVHYISASDYKFQLNIFRDRTLKSKSLKRYLVMYYAGGTSNGGWKGKWLSIRECQKILKDCHVKFGWFTNLCKTATAVCAYIFASRKLVGEERR